MDISDIMALKCLKTTIHVAEVRWREMRLTVSIYIYFFFFQFFYRPSSAVQLVFDSGPAEQLGHILCEGAPQCPIFVFPYMAVVGFEPLTF